MILRYAYKYKFAILGNVACLFTSKIRSEFQTAWILIMSRRHMRRLTTHASILHSVCEMITSMKGNGA